MRLARVGLRRRLLLARGEHASIRRNSADQLVLEQQPQRVCVYFYFETMRFTFRWSSVLTPGATGVVHPVSVPPRRSCPRRRRRPRRAVCARDVARAETPPSDGRRWRGGDRQGRAARRAWAVRRRAGGCHAQHTTCTICPFELSRTAPLGAVAAAHPGRQAAADEKRTSKRSEPRRRVSASAGNCAARGVRSARNCAAHGARSARAEGRALRTFEGASGERTRGRPEWAVEAWTASKAIDPCDRPRSARASSASSLRAQLL